MSRGSIKRRGRPKTKQLIERRCEEILDTAGWIFAKHGYPSTDVQMVADELGVGKGTVYRYFLTKRDLFLAAVDRGMLRLKVQVDAATVGVHDPLERIAEAVRAYLAFFDACPEFVELLVQERAEFKNRRKPTYFEHRDANVGPWQNLLCGLVSDGRVRDIPVEAITDAVGDLLYGAILTNLFAGRRKPLKVQADEILDVVFHGILSDRERNLHAAPTGGSNTTHSEVDAPA